MSCEHLCRNINAGSPLRPSHISYAYPHGPPELGSRTRGLGGRGDAYGGAGVGANITLELPVELSEPISGGKLLDGQRDSDKSLARVARGYHGLVPNEFSPRRSVLVSP